MGESLIDWHLPTRLLVLGRSLSAKVVIWLLGFDPLLSVFFHLYPSCGETWTFLTTLSSSSDEMSITSIMLAEAMTGNAIQDLEG